MKLTSNIYTWLLGASLTSVASLAAAQSDPGTFAETAEEQLTDDTTTIPEGMGAVLVPSLTTSEAEPTVMLMLGGDRVASGRTGQRIIVPAGTYEVVIGQGALSERARTTINVEEGLTATPTAFFGAVRVQLINDKGRPLSDTYVLKSQDRGTVYGPVTMSAEADALKAATWILPAGRYVLALGSDPSSSTDSHAFVVSPGSVMRYRLVVDGGDVIRTELADEDYVYVPTMWRFRWTVGGTASLDSRNTQLTHEGREYILASLFSRMQAGLDTGPHLALVNFDVDQSFVALDSDFGADIPFRTLNNEAALELIYTYRAARIIGPYARATARTSFFENHFLPDGDIDIDTRDEAGNVIAQTEASQGDRVRLFKAFGPTVLQQGVGLSVTPVDNEIIDIGVRAGGAARQAFYRKGRYIEGRDGDTLNLIQVDDRKEFGGEGTAYLGLRITRTFSISSEFDSFFPHKVFTGDQKRFPFRWESTAALRLGRYATAAYTFQLRRDEVVVKELQMTHGLGVTLQASIF